MPGHEMTDRELDAAFAAAMGPGRTRMTEREFQAEIVAEAERLGLAVFWVPAAARTGIGRIAKTARGWPDLVIAGDHGAIFRECKSEDGETTAEQDEWGWRLDRAGLDWAVWRPAHWRSGRIQAELRALSS